MIASDIPAGYKSGASMARSLVTYIDCPREVRRRVMQVFDNVPGEAAIRDMRRRYLHKQDWGEMIDARDFAPAANMDEANERFVAALERERRGTRVRDYLDLA